MNKIVQILVWSLMVFSAQAQVMSGQIIYERKEDWVKKINKAKYLSREEKDRMEQTWKNEEEYIQKMVLNFNENMSHYTHESKTQTSPDGTYTWEADDYLITRDFSKKTLMEYKEMLGKSYLVIDTLQAPKWKILNEIKEVAGYVCMKASTFNETKSQDVIAWFAMDLPVSAGPEEYYGLPGMILELEIDKGAVTVTAVSVFPNKEQKIPDLPKKMKGKKIDVALQNQLIKKYITEQESMNRFPWAFRY
jgi:GLPGLI family protein